MMDIQALINQILILFALILIGYGAQKAKLLPKETGKVISDLVINISNPCTLLYSVFTSDRLLSNGQVLLFLGITTLMYIGTMLVALPVPKILRVQSSQAGMYRYMTVFANVSFLGIPVLRALMGADAVFLCSILNIVFNLSVYTYGQIQVAGDPSQRQITVKMFFTPIMVSSYLSLILYLLNWKAPGGVLSVLSLLDRTTSPLAMLAIGCSMAAYALRDIFLNWRVYVFSVVKLILVPVLTWAVLMPWLHNDLMLGVLVTCAAMPVATNATLMATKYKGDVKLAASGVFITTLFSLITLPALLYILF